MYLWGPGLTFPHPPQLQSPGKQHLQKPMGIRISDPHPAQISSPICFLGVLGFWRVGEGGAPGLLCSSPI